MKPGTGSRPDDDHDQGARYWRRPVIVALAGLLLFVLAAVFFDESVSRTLENWPDHERAFFEWLTRWGEADWMVIPPLVVAILAFLLRGLHLAYTTRWTVTALGGIGAYMVVGIGLPGLTAAILKRIIGRARPLHLDELGTLSIQPISFDWTLGGFPSGHATTGFAFAVVMASLFPRRWAWAFYLFGMMIALSRIVVGMHYLTDVVAGAMLGTVGAMLVRNWFADRRFPIDRRNGIIRNRAAIPLERAWRRVSG